MNRFLMIIKLLLGKDIVIYNTWTKEVLMIIGSDAEVIKKRYDYDFIGKNGEKLIGNETNGKLFYRSDEP